eukprot:9700-Prorocentrum_minimum.AAC.1
MIALHPDDSTLDGLPTTRWARQPTPRAVPSKPEHPEGISRRNPYISSQALAPGPHLCARPLPPSAHTQHGNAYRTRNTVQPLPLQESPSHSGNTPSRLRSLHSRGCRVWLTRGKLDVPTRGLHIAPAT